MEKEKKKMPLWAKNLITSLIFGFLTLISLGFLAVSVMTLGLAAWGMADGANISEGSYNLIRFICFDFLFAAICFFAAGTYKIISQTITNKRQKISMDERRTS